MRDRKKRNIIIGTLCSLIVFMGIGYAILSQTLSISGMANMKGDWDVRITNMELLSENTTGKAKEVSHSYTNTTASFEADLYMPGDSIEYKVTVKNNGNIDAVLKSITPTTTNKNANVEFSHSKIDNTPLKVGNEITFTMKVAFLESATSIPSNNISYTLVLNYIQYDGKSDYVQAVETTEESCFWVTSDGTLVSYDISCGTDIVVPASVDGIPIKRTALYFGATDGYAIVVKEGAVDSVVFKNQSKLDKFIEEHGSDFSETELEEFRSTVIFSEELNSNISDYATYKQTLISSGEEKKKVSKDSSGTITFTTSTSDYNVIYVDENMMYPHKYYCTTEDACELLKEYFRLQSPALEKGISDSSYYEYADASYGLLDELDYLFVTNIPATYQNINSINFSNAIYMENIFLAPFSSSSGFVIKKVVMPPNIEVLGWSNPIYAEEIVFPKNSTTKVISSEYSYGQFLKKVTLPSSLKFIGSSSFAGTSLDSVTIPASVVGIAESAFYNAGLNSLTFQPNSSLIALYNQQFGEDHSVFEKNNLTSITIPASVEYIGSDVFSQNKLTSVTFQGNSNLKYLDTNAFRYNPDLPTVTMPS